LTNSFEIKKETLYTKQLFVPGCGFFFHHHPCTDMLHGEIMKPNLEKTLNIYEEIWTLFYEYNETIDAERMLKDSVEEFGTSLGTIYLSLSEGTTTMTDKMEEHFYTMDEILEEKIDPAIELIHIANPQFHKEYFTLRSTKNTGVLQGQESAMAV
jgi:hypothetical protein